MVGEIELNKLTKDQLIKVIEQNNFKLAELNQKCKSYLAVKEEKERYKKLIESSNAIFWMISPDWMKLHYISANFEHYFGYTRNQIYEDPLLWIRCIHPEDKITTFRKFKKNVGKRFASEYRIINKKRDIIWLKTIVSPIYENGQLILLTGLCEDITDSKKNLEKSLHSEAKFQKMAANIHDGLAISENGNFVYCNSKFTDITGFDLSDLENHSIFDLALPEENSKISEFSKHFLPNGILFRELELWIQDHHGIKKYIQCKFSFNSSQKAHDSFYLIISDLTDKQVQQEILAKREEKFRQLVNNLPECVWVYEVEREHYFVSSSILQITGFTADEFTVHPYFGWELIHPDYKKMVRHHWDNLILKKQLFSIQYPIKTKDDNYVWIEESAYQIQEENGITTIEGLIKDVSKQRESNLIQSIVFNIANAVDITIDTHDFYKIIQTELHKLFDTTNFFIAHYDEKKQSVNLSFLQDEKDTFDKFPVGKTLINYVIEKNKAVILREKDIKKLEEKGIIELVGSLCKIWLGVPLVINKRIIGVLGVQNYRTENAYSKRDLEILQFVSHQVSISIHKKNMEEELRNSEQKNAALLKAIPDLMFEISREGKFVSYKGARSDLIADPKDFLNKKIVNVLPVDLAKQTMLAVQEVLEKNSFITYEYTLPTDGDTGFYEARMVKCTDDTVVSIVRNITTQKIAQQKIEDSLEEKEILLKELHHRVKNNLQIINSMLRLQTSYVKDASIVNILKRSQNRVKSMALVHDKLYHNADFSEIDFREYIINLTQHLLASYSIKPHEFEITYELDSIMININYSIPLGIIINELTTNSILHAFPSTIVGKEIFIKFVKENKHLKLVVRDNGTGFDKDLLENSSDSIGLDLVKSLIQQINAEMTFDNSNGSEFTIIFN